MSRGGKPGGGKIGNAFQASVALPNKHRRHSTKPFSIRLTEEEREALRCEAGDRPLAAYVRWRLFDGLGLSKKVRRPIRRPHSPIVERRALGQVLACLGRTELSASLKTIAEAARMGALPLSPELIEELRSARAEIRTMRNVLMKALGIRVEDSP